VIGLAQFNRAKANKMAMLVEKINYNLTQL